MAKREMSPEAKAARAIKQELKRRGLDVRARSSSFSMGDSVTVDVLTPDLPPDSRKEITAYCEQYQYGEFDGMQDLYEYTNRRDDLPGQTKYISVNFEQSEACKAAILEFLHRTGEPADAWGADSMPYRVWTGVTAPEFWESWPPAKPEPDTVAQGAGYSIEKHHHTKHGFDYWLVILADRVDRPEFERLRDSCKAAGGWYSRAWRGTPGGFGFKEQEQAGAWSIQEFSDHESDPDGNRPAPKPKQNTHKAEKFREMAQKLDAEVSAKRGDHLENTPKRQREGMSRRIDADRLERTAQALEALADLHEAGEVPPLLAKFTSKKAVHAALGVRTESTGYYHVGATDEHTDDSPEAAALWALLSGKDPEQEAAEELHNMRKAVQGSGIAGYFPTPADLAGDMVDRLAISGRKPWRLLEPSAGCGAILDEVAQLANEPEHIQVHEVNGSLCRILEAKGFDPWGDFLRAEAVEDFDAVLMNPPFENLQDCDHVRHAFDFLKPGGRLVSIMSPGPFFRDTAKAREFREWFEAQGGTVEEIEAGAFKESGTGVSSRLVVIDKPAAAKVVPQVEALAGMSPLGARQADREELTEQAVLF